MKPERTFGAVALLWLGSLCWAQVLSFAEVVAAVEASPRVALARAQLELSQRQLEVAASWLQASVSGGYSQRFSTLESAAASTRESDGDLDPIALDAVLNVVPYGPRHDETVRRRWQVEAAERALRDERARVLLEAVQQFQGVVRGQEGLELAQTRLEAAELRLEQARTLERAGAATPSEVRQAELGLEQARQAAAEAERGRDESLNGLAVTLGRPLGGVLPGLVASDFAPSADDSRLALRSDVADARQALEQAELSAAATLRENLPSGELRLGYTAGSDSSSFQAGAQLGTRGVNAYQPTLTASIDPDSGLPGLQPGQRSSAFSVGVGLVVPLEAALPQALEAARLAVETARLRALQALELARLDVRARAADADAAEESLELARAVVRERRESLRLARERLELGLIAPLDALEAEAALKEAALQLHRAEDALLLARMRYAAALGYDPLEVF